jgi:hypothetical protein
MQEQSVFAEQRERVAAYAALLPDIAAVQAHGQHVFVAACLTALARHRIADHVAGWRRSRQSPRLIHGRCGAWCGSSSLMASSK